jgi:hypothetical protein
MSHRRYPPWFAILMGAIGGGMAGLFVLIDQSRRHVRFPISTLKAILGGVALGVIAVQLVWIRDLLRRGERRPGSIVLSSVVPESDGLPSRDVPRRGGAAPRSMAAAVLASGLWLLCLNHVMATALHRIYPALIIGGSFMVVLGLGGLLNPLLMPGPKPATSRKLDGDSVAWSPSMALWSTLLFAMSVGLAVYLWKYVY